MNITPTEKLMYEVMKAVYESGIPVSFKGSMVLKAFLLEKGYDEDTRDRPAQDFLDSFDYKMRCKMIGEIKLLCELGYLLRYPHSEKLTQHIFELRAKQGSNISRCLFFFDKGEKAILTHGFTKKTEKTPRREIDRAESLRTDYLTRRERCNHGK